MLSGCENIHSQPLPYPTNVMCCVLVRLVRGVVWFSVGDALPNPKQNIGGRVRNFNPFRIRCGV